MTKKHYEAIATIINGNTTLRDTSQEKNAIRQVTSNLADYFATDNPKFDRTRFLQACGIEQNPKQ